MGFSDAFDFMKDRLDPVDAMKSEASDAIHGVEGLFTADNNHDRAQAAVNTAGFTIPILGPGLKFLDKLTSGKDGGGIISKGAEWLLNLVNPEVPLGPAILKGLQDVQAVTAGIGGGGDAGTES